MQVEGGVADVVQSFTTFECDGCAHHASFHSLENKAEDEIRKRWEMEQRQKEAEARANKVVGRPKKRARQIERVEPVGRVNRLMIESAAEYIQGGAEGDTIGSDVASTSTSTIEFAPVYTRGRKTKTLTSGGAGSLQCTLRRGRTKANEVSGRSSVVDDQDLVLVD